MVKHPQPKMQGLHSNIVISCLMTPCIPYFCKPNVFTNWKWSLLKNVSNCFTWGLQAQGLYLLTGLKSRTSFQWARTQRKFRIFAKPKSCTNSVSWPTPNTTNAINAAFLIVLGNVTKTLVCQMHLFVCLLCGLGKPLEAVQDISVTLIRWH